MAIIIPSKHIYQKNNPKIRDNSIDRIEVNQTNITPDNQYDVGVYNGKFAGASVAFDEEKLKTYENHQSKRSDTSGGGYQDTRVAATYISVTPIYFKFQIYIPMNQENKFVQSLLLGEDTEGNARIKVSIAGKVKKGTASAEATTDSYNNTQINNISRTITSEPTNAEQYVLPNEFVNGYTSEQLLSVSASVAIDRGDLGSENFSAGYDDNNVPFYFLPRYVLVGAKITKLSGGDRVVNPSSPDITYELNGTYEEYIPEQVEVTVNGNTIGIAINESQVIFGNPNGKKPFSIENNELLQSSNYYLIEDNNALKRQYEAVLGDYKHGKETATLRCDIGEYYHENGDLALSVSKPVVEDMIWGGADNPYIPLRMDKYGRLIYTVPKIDTALWYFSIGGSVLKKGVYQIKIKPTEEGKYYGRVRLNVYDGAADNSPSILDINFGEENANAVYTFELSEDTHIRLHFCSDVNLANSQQFDFEIGLKKLNVTKMAFTQGDIVVPMIFGADGKDRAMSKTKDGTPKMFTVLSSKVYYDGAVWQEIEIQEV